MRNAALEVETLTRSVSLMRKQGAEKLSCPGAHRDRSKSIFLWLWSSSSHYSKTASLKGAWRSSEDMLPNTHKTSKATKKKWILERIRVSKDVSQLLHEPAPHTYTPQKQLIPHGIRDSQPQKSNDPQPQRCTDSGSSQARVKKGSPGEENRGCLGLSLLLA